MIIIITSSVHTFININVLTMWMKIWFIKWWRWWWCEFRPNRRNSSFSCRYNIIIIVVIMWNFCKKQFSSWLMALMWWIMNGIVRVMWRQIWAWIVNGENLRSWIVCNWYNLKFWSKCKYTDNNNTINF